MYQQFYFLSFCVVHADNHLEGLLMLKEFVQVRRFVRHYPLMTSYVVTHVPRCSFCFEANSTSGVDVEYLSNLASKV